MKTIFEQQGVECGLVGNYMLPNVSLKEQKEYHIDVCRQQHKRYLKANHRVLYYNYLTSDKLYEHVKEVDIDIRPKYILSRLRTDRF